MQHNNNNDEKRIIVRVWGSPYYLDVLAQHLGLFDDVISGNVQQGLLDLSEQHEWMSYNPIDRTLFVEDPNPQKLHPVIGGTPASYKLQAIIRLFEYICRDSGWDRSPSAAKTYLAMPEILTFFRASEDLCKQFHSFFPYFKGRFYIENPTRISHFMNGKGLTHWEVLLAAREREGRICLVCGKRNPWMVTVSTSGSEIICDCTLYFNDLLERTSRNPYFDEDNRWQRERDRDDEHRRQMQD